MTVATYLSGTSPAKPYAAIIFDLGDLPSTPPAKTSPLSPKQLLSTYTWSEYGRAHDACCEQACQHPRLGSLDLDSGSVDAPVSDPSLANLIESLRSRTGQAVSVFAMWHVALPFDEVTQAKRPRLSIFDRFFFSKEVRRRQPNLAFYKAVVEKTGVDPRSVILVDDRVENVLSARSLGITGILYKDLDFVAKSLCNLFGDSVSRGLDFMERHARNHLSYTNTDVILHENFAQLLILEALENRRLVKYHSFPRIANFFQGEGTLTTSKFPCDLDTTSLYLSITHDVDAKTVNSVMDDMLTYRNSDGIIEVYFDRFRPRTDPVVCVNVLTLFCTQGRSDDLALEDTIDWVWDVLYNRAYIEGTRYYATPEAFLFFLSRFIQRCPPSLLDRFLPIYTQRLRESIGSKGDALALAMRIIACASVGLRDEVDLERLEKRQERDGGWADGWFYKYGSSGVLIANRGLTTAFAINAIREVKKLREKGVPVSYAGFW